MRRLLLLALAGLVVAGASPSVAANRMQAAPKLTVSSSPFGKILFDGRRRALYAFTRDGRGRSTCYGACAAAWPPFLVTRKPAAASGVRRSLIGTVRRRDGRLQATYAGRPLYFYVGDRKAGQVLCQNVVEFGGTWLVVRASGRLVRGR
jgi:predicted lipoprotein with Yx(FWY)xxD motif